MDLSAVSKKSSSTEKELTFGKYKGRKISSMTEADEIQYLQWMLRQKFEYYEPAIREHFKTLGIAPSAGAEVKLNDGAVDTFSKIALDLWLKNMHEGDKTIGLMEFLGHKIQGMWDTFCKTTLQNGEKYTEYPGSFTEVRVQEETPGRIRVACHSEGLIWFYLHYPESDSTMWVNVKDAADFEEDMDEDPDENLRSD